MQGHPDKGPVGVSPEKALSPGSPGCQPPSFGGLGEALTPAPDWDVAFNRLSQWRRQLRSDCIWMCAVYFIRLNLVQQMGKDEEKGKEDKKAWRLLYDHLAEFSGVAPDTFQYKIVYEYDKTKVALKEESTAFFLLCLKRLANAKLAE